MWQAVTRPVTPGGLGRKFLRNGTRDSQLIPMDLPVGPIRSRTGDGLSVDLWGGVSQRLYRTVDREGRVSLPVVVRSWSAERACSSATGRAADPEDSVSAMFRAMFRSPVFGRSGL